MQIGIVASPSDAHAANLIATALTRIEGSAFVDPNDGEAVIGILIERSAIDEHWIAATTAVTNSRIVPVAVAIERPPPHPNELLDWRGGEVARG
jgi:hypothetical protein